MKKASTRTLDPVATRNAIMESAVRCFSSLGFAGASIGTIADEAGVTKSLVQYHFGSKEQLWNAVARSHVGPFLRLVDRFLEGSGPVDMRDLVLTRFELLKNDPEMVRIIAWVSLEGADVPHEARIKAPMVREKIGQGKPRNGVAADELFLIAIAAMDGWFMGKRLYRGLFGELDDDRFLDSMMKALFGDEG